MIGSDDKINPDRIPRHIAIIMDGNGRWAKSKGRPRVFGHINGIKAVKETVKAATELGVQYLTLYAFSTENWGRPIKEVQALMTLLVDTIKRELKELNENNIKLMAIGDLDALPAKTRNALTEAIKETSGNSKMTLILALNYSAKQEIILAVQKIAEGVKNGQMDVSEITEEVFSSFLQTKDIPDPELLIRTSGEKRISNFLLWQIAYTELYFTPVFWPDFNKERLIECICEYQKRERRFGKTSEQLIQS